MDIQPVVLEGYGVRLEPIEPKHCEGLFAIGQEEKDWLYMPRPCFQSMDDTAQWIEQAQNYQQAKALVGFTIIDLTSNTIAGSSSYLAITPEHRRLEIGYTWLGKDFQRSHVNSAAKLCLLEHAFEQQKALRVEFKADSRNVRSQNALKRLGATQEGVFRQHMVVQNGFVRDSVYFSIIHNEWPQIKAHLQSKL